MAIEVYCDICTEHDALTPTTIEFRVQREADGDATPQYVRSCTEHEGQAAGAAALMRSRMAPAAVYRTSLCGTSAERSVGRESHMGNGAHGTIPPQ
jgi:hypothetical protein